MYTMQFKVTHIEFDFGDAFDHMMFSTVIKEEIIEETMSHIWEADDEDSLIEEITNATGWCVNSIEYTSR